MRRRPGWTDAPASLGTWGRLAVLRRCLRLTLLIPKFGVDRSPSAALPVETRTPPDGTRGSPSLTCWLIRLFTCRRAANNVIQVCEGPGLRVQCECTVSAAGIFPSFGVTEKGCSLLICLFVYLLVLSVASVVCSIFFCVYVCLCFCFFPVGETKLLIFFPCLLSYLYLSTFFFAFLCGAYLFLLYFSV